MAGRLVALIRGINVGRAKRVAMADLRTLVEKLGYRDVRTLLNSGNVVFTSRGGTPGAAAIRIEQAMARHPGISARVIVVTAAELAVAVSANPLVKIATNPSRLMVAFLAHQPDRARLRALVKQDWAPERLALGARVAYLWCPEGVIASPLSDAVGRVLGDAMTVRNWSTVTKLHALARAHGDPKAS